MIPAALSIIWQIATSRVGIAVIAGSLSYGIGYHRGYSRADRFAEIAALESRIAVKDADLTAARNAERVARDQAEILADRAIENQEIVNDLSAELAARPDRDACRISGADAERLRRVDAGEGGTAARSAPLSILSPAGRGAGAAGR